jgi:hypothetical protein
MLTFVFDNDALVHLTQRSNYDSLKTKIQESFERRINRVYFTRVNFWEFVQGVSESNLHQFQHFLREFCGLCQQRYILPLPEICLRESIGRLTRNELETACSTLVKNMQSMLAVRSCEDFRSEFADIQDYLVEANNSLYDAAVADDEAFRENPPSLSKKEITEGISADKSGHFWEKMHKSLLHRFQLDELLPGITPMELARQLPSLFEMSEIYRILLKKILVDGKKPDKGDFFDLQKIVYLGRCDYIVTDDRKFRVLFDEVGTCALFGRCIPLDKFLEHVGRPTLISRLPNLMCLRGFEYPFEL